MENFSVDSSIPQMSRRRLVELRDEDVWVDNADHPGNRVFVDVIRAAIVESNYDDYGKDVYRKVKVDLLQTNKDITIYTGPNDGELTLCEGPALIKVIGEVYDAERDKIIRDGDDRRNQRNPRKGSRRCSSPAAVEALDRRRSSIHDVTKRRPSPPTRSSEDSERHDKNFDYYERLNEMSRTLKRSDSDRSLQSRKSRRGSRSRSNSRCQGESRSNSRSRSSRRSRRDSRSRSRSRDSYKSDRSCESRSTQRNRSQHRRRLDEKQRSPRSLGRRSSSRRSLGSDGESRSSRDLIREHKKERSSRSTDSRDSIGSLSGRDDDDETYDTSGYGRRKGYERRGSYSSTRSMESCHSLKRKQDRRRSSQSIDTRRSNGKTSTSRSLTQDLDSGDQSRSTRNSELGSDLRSAKMRQSGKPRSSLDLIYGIMEAGERPYNGTSYRSLTGLDDEKSTISSQLCRLSPESAARNGFGLENALHRRNVDDLNVKVHFVYFDVELCPGNLALYDAIHEVGAQNGWPKYGRSICKSILKRMGPDMHYFESISSVKQIEDVEILYCTLKPVYMKERYMASNAFLRDVYFDAPRHPGTRALIRAVQQQIIKDGVEPPFDWFVLKKIQDRLYDSSFFVGYPPSCRPIEDRDLYVMIETAYHQEIKHRKLILKRQSAKPVPGSVFCPTMVGRLMSCLKRFLLSRIIRCCRPAVNRLCSPDNSRCQRNHLLSCWQHSSKCWMYDPDTQTTLWERINDDFTLTYCEGCRTSRPLMFLCVALVFIVVVFFVQLVTKNILFKFI